MTTAVASEAKLRSKLINLKNDRDTIQAALTESVTKFMSGTHAEEQVEYLDIEVDPPVGSVIVTCSVQHGMKRGMVEVTLENWYGFYKNEYNGETNVRLRDQDGDGVVIAEATSEKVTQFFHTFVENMVREVKAALLETLHVETLRVVVHPYIDYQELTSEFVLSTVEEGLH